uniref:Uncharacterized protein n=1 Tax=Anguilla anguilla TaxID=7936 RepID=A0A0E9XEF8_ANGAN
MRPLRFTESSCPKCLTRFAEKSLRFVGIVCSHKSHKFPASCLLYMAQEPKAVACDAVMCSDTLVYII